MARISIIIPTYNRAAMLPRAIESAKSAGGDLEVIVVDNGSTDETQEVCLAISGIRYIRLYPNVRQARARNEGIKISTGEFLTFLDDDDQRLPNSLAAQIKLLDSTPSLGFVYGPILLGDHNCIPTGKMSPERCERGDLFWSLLEGNFILLHSVVARKKLIEEVGLFDPEVVGAEDWLLLLRLSEDHAVGVVEEPVGIYRTFTRTSAQTSSNRTEMYTAASRAHAKALKLPRALQISGNKRQEMRDKFLAGLSWMLMDEAVAMFAEGNYRGAAANCVTALRLSPRRSARPYWLRRFVAEKRNRPDHAATRREEKGISR